MSEIDTVAFVGTGQMGGRLADLVQGAGYRVTRVDRVVEEVDGRSLRELEGTFDVVCVATPGPGELATVVDECLDLDARLRPSYVVNLSTVGPGCAIDVDRRLALEAPEIVYVDCPVVGGVIRAERQECVLLYGSRSGAPDTHLSGLLESMSRRLFDFGGVAEAQIAKLVNNVSAVSVGLATEEALQLGVDSGLDLEPLIELLREGTADSYILRNSLTRALLGGDLETGFKARLALKDMKLANALRRGDTGDRDSYIALAIERLEAQVRDSRGDLTFISGEARREDGGDGDPSPEEAPGCLKFEVLMQHGSSGPCRITWLAPEGSEAEVGAPLVRGFVSGAEVTQAAILPIRVERWQATPGESIEVGMPILLVAVPSLAPIAVADDRQMELAQAVNTAFKGLVAADGQGGHIAKSVTPIATRLRPELGVDSLLSEILGSLSSADLHDGDVVVVSESLFAIAQDRLFPLDVLYEFDPKTTDDRGREIALQKIREYVPDTEAEDLLCADALPQLTPPMATAGMRDPNGIAFRLAERLRGESGCRCDVVISDTDTGLEVRKTLIGCITIGSTPLGATAGLVLYECMRAASAAEFCRGSSRGIPVVICRPHQRRANRPNIGESRGYQGRLNFERERLIGYA